MSQPEPLTEQQLDEYAASVAVYRQHAPTGFACCSAHPVADAGVALLAEVRRQRAELAAFEMLAPQQCPAGLHADWLVDSEYAHACPWCRIAELESPASNPDSLPAWLYRRFMVGGVGWENLDADDRAYWEHQARAVRRAVVRGGFRTAPEAASAPLAACQPSEAPVEPGAATRPPTGRTGDPRRTLTPNEYDAAWHAIEGAAGDEGADPGTILHAVLDRLGIDWQDAARPATATEETAQ